MNWTDYLAGMAAYVATKSKDSTQVGAVLVAPDGRQTILTAFNGPPAGVDDEPARRQRPEKYLFASHAEANLIARAARHGIRTEECDVYLTHFPCAACARSLIQAGVRSVNFGPGQTSMPNEEFAAAEVMFREAGVACVATGE